MSRQNRRRADIASRAPYGVVERRDDWRGEQFVVRTVSGQSAVKAYRCPGCDQEIRAGVPHVVTWPASDASGEDRRHWHRVCWDARDRRGPGVLRSRSAPRF